MAVEKMFGVYVGTDRCGGRAIYMEAKHLAETHRLAAMTPCLVHCFDEEWDGTTLVSVSHVNSWQASAGGRSPGYTAADIMKDEEQIRAEMARGGYNPQF